jgi:serine/threonine-protein kinase HipA
MQGRCLYCYEPLNIAGTDFHPACCRKFFGTETPPVLPYSSSDIQDLAADLVLRSVAVTGVQPKLSLELQKDGKDPKSSRLTIVGLWGNYILKPQTDLFPYLPENEDLTMHLASAFGIETAEHCLIRLSEGALAYITKRFDRQHGKKVPQEDFCQITETQTADKYRSSLEKVGKHLRLYSAQPGLDAFSLFKLTLFCFITGNADMHLKNYSLLSDRYDDAGRRIARLAPAYDLLNTRIVMPEDAEETALTINAKKRKLAKKDFDALGRTMKMPEARIKNAYAEIAGAKQEALGWMARSFLTADGKQSYEALFEERWQRIFDIG